MLKVEYLYQSGFTVETENHFLVFDYYRGELKIPHKNTTFFVTHGHEDHYNQKIFDYKSRADYIISDDITGLEEDYNIKLVHKGDNFSFKNMYIRVFGSTDQGSSFLVSLDGINIFHSGDLNWWAWEDMGQARELERKHEYTSEINKLKNLNISIDLAFVPVDPRLRHNYYLAGDYFIKTLKPKYFFPMHFGDNYTFNQKFIHKMKDFNTHIPNVDRKNQLFTLSI